MEHTQPDVTQLLDALVEHEEICFSNLGNNIIYYISSFAIKTNYKGT
jgi:hypothetical protein